MVYPLPRILQISPSFLFSSQLPVRDSATGTDCVLSSLQCHWQWSVLISFAAWNFFVLVVLLLVVLG